MHGIHSLAPEQVVRDPLGYAAGIAGLTGLQAGAFALQRHSVIAVTATMVAAETLLGSVLGILLGGDRTVEGREPMAAAGFVAVLVGALLLTRFGGSLEPQSQHPGRPSRRH